MPRGVTVVAGVAEGFFLAGEFEVGVDHAFDEFVEADAWVPAELVAGFGGVALEGVDFGGALVAGVDLDVVLPVEVEAFEDLVDEAADGVGVAGGDDVVVGVGLVGA